MWTQKAAHNIQQFIYLWTFRGVESRFCLTFFSARSRNVYGTIVDSQELEFDFFPSLLMQQLDDSHSLWVSFNVHFSICEWERLYQYTHNTHQWTLIESKFIIRLNAEAIEIPPTNHYISRWEISVSESTKKNETILQWYHVAGEMRSVDAHNLFQFIVTCRQKIVRIRITAMEILIYSWKISYENFIWTKKLS